MFKLLEAKAAAAQRLHRPRIYTSNCYRIAVQIPFVARVYTVPLAFGDSVP